MASSSFLPSMSGIGTLGKDIEGLIKKIPKSFSQPLPGVGNLPPAIANIGKSKPGGAPSDPSPYAAFAGMSPEAIYKGQVDVSHLPLTIDTNDAGFKALQKSHPDVAKAIQDRRAYDLQQLQAGMQQGSGGVGAGVANPMAVQMMYQNLIQPFLNQSNQQAQGQINSYQKMMGQVLNDPSIPQVYRSTLAAQVPGQVENLQSQLSANQQQALYSPEQAQLSNLITQLIQQQQARQRYDVMYGTGPAQTVAGQINSQFLTPQVK